MLTVISLGAGVQSTVMTLMADRGELGDYHCDAAIFADTGWEPRTVYKNLEWLRSQVSIPIKMVSSVTGPSLRTATENFVNVNLRSTAIPIPVYIRNPDNGKGMLQRRQCTHDWKIMPVQREMRRLLGAKQYGRVSRSAIVLLGLSIDEIERVAPSRRAWISNRHPLIELNMSRWDCKEWMKTHYPSRVLPRSACSGCPFRSDEEWIDLKNTDPIGFASAVKVDQLLRSEKVPARLDGKAFLHRKLIPLTEAVAEAEAGINMQPRLFGEECSGLCGV